MHNISWTFHLRWVLWGAGAIGIIILFFKRSLLNLKNLENWERLEKSCEIHFRKILGIICGVFFVLAALGKYSQWWTLSLNAQDFWLYVDQLEQMKKGAFFLTRFAPQELGFVQHGAVHPSFSWVLWLPVAWVLGSTQAALLYGPVCLSAGGWILGWLTRKRWGALSALCFALAFLASTQCGKVLMYDVHPESAYPFLIFLWLWGLGLDENGLKGSSTVRWGAFVFATLGCIGIKEDFFLILVPWILWAIFYLRGVQRKAAWVSLGLVIAGLGLDMMSVRNWISGVWGPLVWQGRPVMMIAGIRDFQGLHWTSLKEAGQIVDQLIITHQGMSGVFKGLGKFLISRPWLSLLIFAPWVVLQGRFWWVILPLAGMYSLIDRAKVLWNYYSAPFLGSFWYCVGGKVPKVSQRNYALWTLGASFILGSGSVQIFWPSSQVETIKAQTRELVQCIEGKQGLVQTHLIGLVPFETIWTDRIPRTPEQWQNLEFALFSPDVSRFELPLEQAQQLDHQLSQSSDWIEVGPECRRIEGEAGKGGKIEKTGALAQREVVLFLRKSVSPAKL